MQPEYERVEVVLTLHVAGWQGEGAPYLTLMMVDPDAPVRQDRANRHWLHWLVVDVRGHCTSSECTYDPQGTACLARCNFLSVCRNSFARALVWLPTNALVFVLQAGFV
jgi:phosphatidylethanolamine-binding protein (PEBP) family uncharacterized protein